MQLYRQLKANMALLPQTIATTTVTGIYLPAAMVRRMLFTLIAGAMASGNTITLALYQATDASGTSAKAITGATCTITASAAKTSGLAFVELDTSMLDNNNGFEYVAARVTTNASLVAGVTCHAGENRFSPDIAADAYAVVGN
jgi:hypothetical protein